LEPVGRVKFPVITTAEVEEMTRVELLDTETDPWLEQVRALVSVQTKVHVDPVQEVDAAIGFAMGTGVEMGAEEDDTGASDLPQIKLESHPTFQLLPKALHADEAK
jgi:hypothetical protein